MRNSPVFMYFSQSSYLTTNWGKKMNRLDTHWGIRYASARFLQNPKEVASGTIFVHACL